MLLSLFGCASDRGDAKTTPLPERPPGALEIRLEFGAQADLDLFVTDPDQETVYFGNTPSRSGGLLVEDQRCLAKAPRLEIVRFAQPKPGRYRVGVEYNRSCRFRRKPARYRIGVRADGLELIRNAEIAPHRFDNTALEFQLDEPSAHPPHPANPPRESSVPELD